MFPAGGGSKRRRALRKSLAPDRCCPQITPITQIQYGAQHAAEQLSETRNGYEANLCNRRNLWIALLGVRQSFSRKIEKDCDVTSEVGRMD
jgi:hypothetical protein